MTPELEYGYCFVTGGQHKGKVVLYDNDETKNKAIIYVDGYLGGYSLISRKLLRIATPEELGNHNYKNISKQREKIFREVFIENVSMARENTIKSIENDNSDSDAPLIIEDDIKKQFEMMLAATDKVECRKQLLRLIVLSVAWVEIIDQYLVERRNSLK